jgi:hypothetical protein
MPKVTNINKTKTIIPRIYDSIDNLSVLRRNVLIEKIPFKVIYYDSLMIESQLVGHVFQDGAELSVQYYNSELNVGGNLVKYYIITEGRSAGLSIPRAFVIRASKLKK